jgi:hypothetical protein
MDVVTKAVHLHVGVPVGLGSRMQGLASKLHAFEHSNLMEVGGLQELELRNLDFVYMTGDFGTESGMSDASARVADLFPWLMSYDQSDGSAGASDAEGSESRKLGGEHVGVGDRAEDGQVAATAAAVAADGAGLAAEPQLLPQPDIVDGLVNTGPSQEATLEAAGRIDYSHYLFQRMLYCPGWMHILHNISTSTVAVLEHAKDFFKDLKCVIDTLDDIMLRDRLMHFCFRSGPAKPYAFLLEDFSAELMEIKWEYLVENILKTWDLRVALESIELADLELFRQCPGGFRRAQVFGVTVGDDGGDGGDEGAPAQEGQEDGNEADNEADSKHSKKGRNANVTGFCKSIRSDYFWKYGEMLLKHEVVLASAGSWLQACPCHMTDSDCHVDTKWMREQKMTRLYGGDSRAVKCVFQSCRIPELVAGDFTKFVNRVMTISQGEVLQLCCGLSESERGSILKDWANGKRHIGLQLNLKTAYLNNLPFRFLALGHHDLEKARANVKIALDLFTYGMKHQLLFYFVYFEFV